MTTQISRFRVQRGIVLVLLFMLALAAGCQKQVLKVPEAAQGTPVAKGSASLSAQALNAFQNADFEQAQLLYDRFLQHPDLTEAQRRGAWQNLAVAAMYNGRHHTSLEALDKWLALESGADQTSIWRDTWLENVRHMPDSTAYRLLENMFRDTDRPWTLRAEARLLLAGRQWQNGEITQAFTSLADLYANAETKAYRAALEQRLFEEFGNVDDSMLGKLGEQLTPENELTYPYSVLMLEQARRKAQSKAGWEQAWQAMHRLMHNNALADSSIVERLLLPLEEQYGKPSQGIALCLPLSGPYGNIGWKILRGASVAQWELARLGHDISVRIINTDSSDWLQQLEELPEGVSVVGGPLRKPVFETIRRNGLLDDRRFFAFMSSLDDGEEGRKAWRFFSSPKDQITTLLEFTQHELGIQDFGALYPDEPFGHRMAELFTTTAAEMQTQSVNTASYTPGESTSWGSVFRDFLDVQPAPQGMDDPLPPETPFQAVFLPDGWNTMELLIPHFYFYQEDRLVLMGSALWEQGLSKVHDQDTRYFGLAVFPGSWNPFAPTAAAESLTRQLEESGLGKPDTWVGIGYDFVRFGSLLGSIDPAASSDEVNEQIRQAQEMDWSTAPIRWNENGIASQKMHLFTPSSDGFVPLDAERFKARLEFVRERHDKRVEMLMEEYENEQVQDGKSTVAAP